MRYSLIAMIVLGFLIYDKTLFRTFPSGELGMRFEYLGCVDDWDKGPIDTIITSETIQNTSIFVQDPATCGLDRVANPSYKINNNTLILSYDYEDTDGLAAACYCNYQSRFTFIRPPKSINRIEFKSQLKSH